MSPVHRRLKGDVLTFQLAREMGMVRSELAAGRSRVARTLVKEGPLRLTLIGLSPGAELQPHHADGPISIHLLEGDLLLDVAGVSQALTAGSLAAVDRGVPHAVCSLRGGLFLLTLATTALRDDPPRRNP